MDRAVTMCQCCNGTGKLGNFPCPLCDGNPFVGAEEPDVEEDPLFRTRPQEPWWDQDTPAPGAGAPASQPRNADTGDDNEPISVPRLVRDISGGHDVSRPRRGGPQSSNTSGGYPSGPRVRGVGDVRTDEAAKQEGSTKPKAGGIATLGDYGMKDNDDKQPATHKQPILVMDKSKKNAFVLDSDSISKQDQKDAKFLQALVAIRIRRPKLFARTHLADAKSVANRMNALADEEMASIGRSLEGDDSADDSDGEQPTRPEMSPKTSREVKVRIRRAIVVLSKNEVDKDKLPWIEQVEQQWKRDEEKPDLFKGKECVLAEAPQTKEDMMSQRERRLKALEAAQAKAASTQKEQQAKAAKEVEAAQAAAVPTRKPSAGIAVSAQAAAKASTPAAAIGAAMPRTSSAETSASWQKVETANASTPTTASAASGSPQEQAAPTAKQAVQQTQQVASSGPKFCTECGHPLTPTQKFCPECGHKVEMKEVPPTPSAAVAPDVGGTEFVPHPNNAKDKTDKVQVPVVRQESMVREDDIEAQYGIAVSLELPQTLTPDNFRAFRQALLLLQREPEESRLRAYKLLLTIIRNALRKPDDIEKRQLRRSKQAVTNMLQIGGMEACLLAMGFRNDASGQEPFMIAYGDHWPGRLEEAYPIILGHVRCFFISRIQAWIRELTTTPQYADDKFDQFRISVLPSIVKFVDALMEAAFAPEDSRYAVLSEKEVKGIKDKFKTCLLAGHVIKILQKILNDVTQDVMRSVAYQEETMILDLPSLAEGVGGDNVVGSLEQGTFLRIVRAVDPFPWVQIVRNDQVAFARRFNDDDDDQVRQVFIPTAKVHANGAQQRTENQTKKEAIAVHTGIYLHNQRLILEKHQQYQDAVSQRQPAKAALAEFKKKFITYVACPNPICPTHPMIEPANRPEFERLQALAEDTSNTDILLCEVADLSAPMRDAVQKLQALGVNPEDIVIPNDRETPEDGAPPPMLDLTRAKTNDTHKIPAMVSLKREISVPHAQFSNSSETSCWMSCVFQSLWHSTVFRIGFEQYLRTHDATRETPIVTAFRNTWQRYSTSHKVSPTELQDALGIRGYNDVADGLSRIQNAFEESNNDVLKCMGQDMATNVILQLREGEQLERIASPRAAWQQCEVAELTGCPLIAVTLAAPVGDSNERVALGQFSSLVAMFWIPQTEVQDFPDMGQHHRLVAMSLFLEEYNHYVVLCRSQRDPSRCRVFNDLEHMLPQLDVTMPWSEVPEICRKYHLFPKLILFESSYNTRDAVARHRRNGDCQQM